MAVAVDPAAVGQLFGQGHTAYTFTTTGLPRRTLGDIWALAGAGGPPGSQPLRVVAVRSRVAKARLVALLHPSNQPKTRAAPLTVILAADTCVEIPGEIPGDTAGRAGDGGVHDQQVMADAGVQVGCFILAVRALGLGVGPVGGLHRAGVDSAFFPDTGLRTLLVVNIGQPAPDAFFPRRPRLTANDVIRIV